MSSWYDDEMSLQQGAKNDWELQNDWRPEDGFVAYDDPGLSLDRMSVTKYNLMIGAVLLWGFVVNAMLCTTMLDTVLNMNYWVLLIGYTVLCIAGRIICNKSDNPIISFIGYNMIVIPVGIVMTPLVNAYDIGSVQTAFYATAIVTMLMMGASVLWPRLFLSTGWLCGVALLVGLIAELVLFLLGMNVGIFDFVFVGVFSWYIGYDWAAAQSRPYSLDSAVDCACELYLDIINLFLRLLRLLSRTSGNSRD